MGRYTSGKRLRGSLMENEAASAMARRVMTAGRGTTKEQQQEQLELQLSVSCRSEQGQCGAGTCREAIPARELPLRGELEKGGSRFAKLSSGRNRWAHTMSKAISCL